MDTDVDRARWRFTLNRRVLDRLQVGVEFNAAAEEVGPLFTWFLLTEDRTRPSLFLGTSSDRIGTSSEHQAYYATLGKSLPALGASAYFSLNWSENDAAWTLPFGAALDTGRGTGVRYLYDGRRSHALFDLNRGPMGVSLLWVWLERFGMAVHGGF